MYQVTQPVYVEDLINDPTFDINNWFGYVYCTFDPKSGKSYIGKKNFFLTTSKKLGKKEIAALPTARGRTPSKKKIIKESDWKTYYGSAEEIKKMNKEGVQRILIRLCKSSKELTYYEVKTQFTQCVLENDNYLNNNILGRFFRKDLE